MTPREAIFAARMHVRVRDRDEAEAALTLYRELREAGHAEPSIFVVQMPPELIFVDDTGVYFVPTGQEKSKLDDRFIEPLGADEYAQMLRLHLAAGTETEPYLLSLHIV